MSSTLTMPAALALVIRPSSSARAWAALLAALTALLFGSAPALAFTPPPIEGHVTDLSGKLTPHDRAALNAKLDGFRRETKNEVAVLLVPSLGGETIEDVAYATFNGWKIGQRGEDNGVLLVIATGDRKIRIETGKGVGGSLTDLQSAEIIREQIGPALKEDRFYDGVNAGTDAIATALNGGKAPPGAAQPAPPAKVDDQPGIKFFCLWTLGIVLLIFVYIQVDQYLRRKGRKGLNGGGGGGGSGGSGGGGSSGGGGGYSGGGGSSGGGGASGSY